MHRFLTAVALLLLTNFLACGGGSSAGTQPPPTIQPVTQPVTVTLSESSVTMDTSAEINIPDVHNFSATVQNASDSGLSWAVNGVVGGDGMTAHGTISTAGAYTAPAWIPSDRITVTATSRQDPSKSASATITLRWYVSSVSVSPASATVKTGEQLKVDGYVGCKGPSTLIWTINGMRVGSAQLGALTTNSNWANSIFYIAPAVKPGGPITLTATSVANPSKSASATITVIDSDSGEPTLSISPPAPSVELGATQQFTAALTNSADTPSWSVALSSNQQTNGFQTSKLVTGFLSGGGMYTAPYELPPDKVVVTAHVTYPAEKYAYAIVDVQPPAVSPNTRINGSYVVQLSDSQHMNHVLGLVNADGNGHLTGTVDVNTTSGFLPGQSFSGTYSVGADGRGSATISYTPIPGTTVPLTLRLMLQSNSLAFLYSQDTYLGQTTGTLEKQATATYDTLQGSFAFLLRGLDVNTGATPPTTLTSQPIAVAGVLTESGNKTLTGSAEEQGAVVPPASLAGSSYTIAADGRGTITLNVAGGGIAHLNFVMVSPQKFRMMTTDAVTVPSTNPALMIGTAEQQQGGPFDLTSLTGPFVFYDNGPNWAQLARFESDGKGTLSNGVMDYRDWSGGSISVSPYAGLGFTGSYSLVGNGRGTLQITDPTGSQSGSGVFYMIANNKFFLLYPTGRTAATGEGFTQEPMANSFDWTGANGRYAVQMSGPINPGLGWFSPPAGWLGWLDYGGALKNESNLMLNPYFADVNGTGNLNIGFGNGAGMPMMRYYMVSDSRVFVIYTYDDLEANDFLGLRKLQ